MFNPFCCHSKWFFFGQQPPKSNLETDSCNFSNVRVNGVDFSQTNCAETSLILYLNEILKERLIVGEIIIRKNKD